MKFEFSDQKASKKISLCRAFLPVVKRVAEKLGLHGETVITDTIGVGGMSTQQVTKNVNVVNEDKMGCKTVFEVIVLGEVCGDALPIPENILIKICNTLNVNPKVLYTNGGEIDLLLGVNVFQLHKQSRLSKDIDGCSIMETRFGLCIVGKACQQVSAEYKGPTN